MILSNKTILTTTCLNITIPYIYKDCINKKCSTTIINIFMHSLTNSLITLIYYAISSIADVELELLNTMFGLFICYIIIKAIYAIVFKMTLHKKATGSDGNLIKLSLYSLLCKNNTDSFYSRINNGYDIYIIYLFLTVLLFPQNVYFMCEIRIFISSEHK